MTLKFVLLFIGWVFVLIPTTVFVVVSAKVIKGAAGDDPMIMALSLIGITTFLIGVITLLLLYLTNLL